MLTSLEGVILSLSELSGGELRQAVYRIVARELGSAALARFIQENYPGSGDYTAERQMQEQPNVEDIVRELRTELT